MTEPKNVQHGQDRPWPGRWRRIGWTIATIISAAAFLYTLAYAVYT